MEKDCKKRIRLREEIEELVEKTFPNDLHQQELLYCGLFDSVQNQIREQD